MMQVTSMVQMSHAQQAAWSTSMILDCADEASEEGFLLGGPSSTRVSIASDSGSDESDGANVQEYSTRLVRTWRFADQPVSLASAAAAQLYRERGSPQTFLEKGSGISASDRSKEPLHRPTQDAHQPSSSSAARRTVRHWLRCWPYGARQGALAALRRQVTDA